MHDVSAYNYLNGWPGNSLAEVEVYGLSAAATAQFSNVIVDTPYSTLPVIIGADETSFIQTSSIRGLSIRPRAATAQVAVRVFGSLAIGHVIQEANPKITVATSALSANVTLYNQGLVAARDGTLSPYPHFNSF